jgi:hypothetical protein
MSKNCNFGKKINEIMTLTPDIAELRGRGPCAATFEGTECPFYPALPMIQESI